MPRILVGVMGPGEGASAELLSSAYELGRRIAEEKWVLLTGGRAAGVMDEASRGAKSAAGLTVGVLPTDTRANMSEWVDIPILTDIGWARNNINVLSSDVVIVCGMSTGTASEVALALKSGKNVILLHCSKEGLDFFSGLEPGRVFIASTAEDAVARARELIEK